MKSTTKLKDEARKHEQKEEWEKAIKVYLQVLEADGDLDGGDVELPLYNRVGDLYVRIGRSGDAVRYYEQAADRYAEAGLYNNAIALCNKALRYAPAHTELLRKLGHFSASQGFLTDARRYFLEYAEKKLGSGETVPGLRALEEFANLTNDAEVRELLGRKLHIHGRSKDAVRELKRAYEMRLSAGELAAAEALRGEILAIEPGAMLADAGTFAAVARTEIEPSEAGPASVVDVAPDVEDEPKPITDLTALTETNLAPASGAASMLDAEAELGGDYALELHGFESGAAAPDAISEPAEETSLLEGFESMHFEGFGESPGADMLAGLEAATEFEAPAEIDYIEMAGGDEPAGPDLPLLETDALAAPPVDETPFELPTDSPDFEAIEAAADPVGFELPLLGNEEEEEEEEAEPEPLPMLEPLAEFDDASLAPPTAPDAPPDLIDLSTIDFGGTLRPLTDRADDLTLPHAPEAPSSLEEPQLFDEPPVEEPSSLEEPSAIREVPPLAALPPLDELPSFDELPTFEEEEAALAALEALEAAPGEEAPGEEAPGEEAPGEEVPAAFEPPPEIELPTFDMPFPGAPPVEAAEPPLEEPVEYEAEEAFEDEPFEAALPAIDEPEFADSEPAFEELETTAFADVVEPIPELELPTFEIADFDAPPVEEPPAEAPAEPRAAEEKPVAEAQHVELPAVPPTSSYIDLGMLVLEDEEKDLDTRFVVEEKEPSGDEDRDFAELLSQFKQKIAEHVSAEDAAAHYHLGLAFKEMGLVDEAIREFQVAMRTGDMRLKVYEELGHCFLLKGQYTVAEKVLQRALELKYEDELELLGVYYHLGRAYEELGRREQARDAYERVIGLDINFGDVAERLARL